MYIRQIKLKNFRNYQSLTLDLDKYTNIFYGNNAQGKTNILEAVYLCSTSRSHKGSKEKEMILFDQTEAHIKVTASIQDMDRSIDLHLRKDRAKGAALDGLPIRKVKDLLGILRCVFFSPEDLFLIKSGPSARRHFIDTELCQIDPVYYSNLALYQKTITQRNSLLKEMRFRPSLEETLDIWDEQLVRYGSQIIDQRHSFLLQLNEIVHEIHENLSGKTENLLITYEPDIDADRFREVLKKNRSQDKKWNTTTTGPHRDDFKVTIDGVDLRKYGSQGQQRTAALSLKLSEISMIRRTTSQTPILLLDDVLSELDKTRQNLLLESINGVQTLLTCTGLDDFVNTHFQMNRIFHVVNGTVKELQESW